MKNKEILVAILTRVASKPNAVKVFFQRAGLPFDENNITVRDLRNLIAVNPQIFNECMDYVFPDASQVFGTASATGSFDWQGLVGGILSGAGGAFLGMSDSTAQANATQMAMAEAEAEKALAEQKAASTRNTVIIVLGVLVLVVVAGVFIFKKRF